MKYLTHIARITTPAAMVVFLSYELSRSLAVTGWWYAFLLIGSLATAIGVEIVGILAGHTLEGYWRLRDAWRSLLALALLLAYTIAAVHILRHNPTLAVVPIIAAIVYILAALADGLHTAETHQEQQAAATLEYDLQRQRAEDDHRRRMQAAELRLKHEAKLARIQARASTQPAQSKSKPAPASYECEDCNRSFASVQALNAHGRFCSARHPERANGATQ
jgi:hypothetical protein